MVKIKNCIIGSSSDIGNEYINLIKKKNMSVLLTSRKDIDNHTLRLDTTNETELLNFQTFLQENKVVFSRVLFFVGIHDRRDFQNNLKVNFYSLVRVFSILINHMNEKSVFTYISSEAHKLHFLPIPSMRGYAISKLYSLTFLYYVRDKVQFNVDAYSPPFTKTSMTNHPEYFFNRMENIIMKPKQASKVAEDILISQQYSKGFYKCYQKYNSKMDKKVYSLKFEIKVINMISKYFNELKYQKGPNTFHNLDNLLFSRMYNQLERDQLLFTFSKSIISDSIVLKIKNLCFKIKHKNKPRHVLNINQIKDPHLVRGLRNEYLLVLKKLNEIYNLKLKEIELKNVEVIDIYYYPKGVKINKHVDYYQSSTQFKFNTVIYTDNNSPMHVFKNKHKLYTKNSILFRPNVLEHGVDEYKCERILLQFVFDSDNVSKINSKTFSSSKSKLIRALENKNLININQINGSMFRNLILLVILIIIIISIIVVVGYQFFKKN